MKYCTHCGSQVNDEAVVCINCGCPVNGGVQQSAFKLDILSLVGFILSFFVPIAGLIVSIIANNRLKTSNDKTSKNFALAGMIISIVELAAIVLVVVLAIVIEISVIAAYPYF